MSFVENSIHLFTNFLNFLLLVCNLYNSGLGIIHFILVMSRYVGSAYIRGYLVVTFLDRSLSTGSLNLFFYLSLNYMNLVLKIL